MVDQRATDSWVPTVALLAAGALAVAASRTGPTRLLPESFEMLASGRCWIGTGPCGTLDPLWWPPLYGVMAAVLEVVLPVGAALSLVSLIPTALVVLPLSSLAGRIGGTAGAVLAGLTLVALPTVRQQALTADARGLALALMAAAWALATRDGSVTRAGLAGLLAGLAVLTRGEAALTALLLPVVAAARWRDLKVGLVAAASVGAVAGPWWAALGWQAGAPTLLPRSVEARAAPLLDLLPRADVAGLIGESAAETPFRTAALHAGPPSGLERVDLAGGMTWLAAVGQDAGGLLAWLAPLALGVAVLAGRAWTVLALVGLVAPALAAALLPRPLGGTPALADLLPLTLAAATLVGGALGATGRGFGRGAGERVRPRAAVAAGGVAAAALLVLVASRPPEAARVPPPGHATQAVGRAVRQHLAAAPPGTVRASLAAAPLVHLSSRPWDPWPAPWDRTAWTDPERAPARLLVTDRDPGWRDALRVDGWDVEAVLGDTRSWAVILAPVERPPPPTVAPAPARRRPTAAPPEAPPEGMPRVRPTGPSP